MIRLVTIDDFIDVYVKLHQRGIRFLLSKFFTRAESRAISAFDQSFEGTSNWWEIPMVKERWNSLVTGNPSTDFDDYFIEKYASPSSRVRALSLGCGACQHELALASNPVFEEIVCVDINRENLDAAAARASELGLKNLSFRCVNIDCFDFSAEKFDIVMFHQSLHHFPHIANLLGEKIPLCLAPNGILLINEYVGATRFQYPKEQIRNINKAIRLIPHEFKRRFKTSLYKKHYYGSGLLRMVIADPSEAIDSASIVPTLRKYYDIVEEKSYGGNILVSALKDIAFHFTQPDGKAQEALLRLFAFEDTYLTAHTSDFIFGIYRVKL